MITEKQLKDKVTPDIIRKMVELAEGFEWDDEYILYKNQRSEYWNGLWHYSIIPLLIHRAVEGWNKMIEHEKSIDVLYRCINYGEIKSYNFSSYQPESLTACECALLEILVDVLKDDV